MKIETGKQYYIDFACSLRIAKVLKIFKKDNEVKIYYKVYGLHLPIGMMSKLESLSWFEDRLLGDEVDEIKI